MQVMMDSFFVSCLLNVSGKTLKRDIKPKQLAESILGKKVNTYTESDKERLRKEFAWAFDENGKIKK